MIRRNFILATAGHVDHGKSSLVKALTGTDPDRLPEEKARGITIVLGFAELELQGMIGAEPGTFHVGIVDVPGHEDFVKNMVAGVGSIDVALFVVAADDGWMPQTEEHLQILTYLGVKRAVVALTKIDLAEDEGAIQEEVRLKLAGSPFSQAPIIPTSIVSGRGFNDLKEALSTVLQTTTPPQNIGKPRLPVDRVFMLRGVGTVVTGTLIGGEFNQGESVVVQPRGIQARIRSLQNHNVEVEASEPGLRTAVNLVDLKTASGEAGVERGDVITVPSLGEATTSADVLLEKSARLSQGKFNNARMIKDGARVRVHLGSSDVPARVLMPGGGGIEPGDKRIAQLRFEKPLYAVLGDRFIIRDWAQQTTLGGGVVLDPDPPMGNLKERIELLKARAATPDNVAVMALTEALRFHAVAREGLLSRSRFSRQEISAALEKLAADKRVTLEAAWALETSWWNRITQNAEKLVDAAHRERPDRPGLPLEELRSAVEQELPVKALFDVLVGWLVRSGFTQSGTALKRTTHALALPPNLLGTCKIVRQMLAAKPIDPPSRKELAPNAQAQQALKFLVESGEAIVLSDDVVLLSSAFAEAASQVRFFLERHKTATASELRQALGTSRRVLIPLLEKLDQKGVTRREGDKRVLRA